MLAAAAALQVWHTGNGTVPVHPSAGPGDQQIEETP